jgi:hypothetical protein
VWFDDADLIVQVGSKQFRVYKGLLAKWSLVFGDMLSMPQADVDGTTSRTEPISLQLPDHDDPEGIEYLFKALHDRT